ncbi:MAG: phage terminase large subunit [Aliarcobacter sp.]|jgi:phage terminase large subunit
MPLIPTERQKQGLELLSDPAKTRVLFTGGSRSGKTFLLIEYLIQRAYQFPGSRQLIVRKHLVDARMSLWYDTLEKYLSLYIPEGEYVKRQSELRLVFRNGSEIWLAGLDDEERSKKILGNEYLTIYCNEAVELSYGVITTLITRLAQKCFDASGHVGVNKMLLDCNPSHPRHWLKLWGQDFLDPSASPPTPLKDADNHAFLHFTPYDNRKHLPEGYIEQLDALPFIQRERMLYGKWCGGDGAIFRDFNEKVHVVEPFSIPSSWALSVAIDFGYDHPAAILWGAYDYGTDAVYIYREWREQGRTIDEIAAKIKNVPESEFYRYDVIWADHALADRAFLHREGVVTRPAKKSVLDGITAINQRLRVNAKTGMPRLVVFNTCKALIDEMYSYEWRKTESQVVNKESPVKVNDDLVDCLRYIVYGLDKGGNVGLI